MILLIDNYDSFTYNLVHYLNELGEAVRVERNDALTVEDVLTMKPDAVVISPGPGTPDDAGISRELIRHAPGHFPVLGVCLGHQCIGEVFGAKVVRGGTPMHGKVSAVTHHGGALFAGLPTTFNATRYHSLVIDPATLPACLEVTAETDDGAIMAVSHREHPIHGVQFHPESIASEHGHAMLANFLKSAKGRV